jgi:hypothetical protein
LHGGELGDRAVEARAVADREPRFRRAGEAARRLDADRSDRIAEHARQVPQPDRRIGARQHLPPPPGAPTRRHRRARADSAGSVDGASQRPSREIAVARTIAGCARSSISASSAACAPGAPLDPALKAAANCWYPAGGLPVHAAIASAAHRGVLLRVAAVARVRHAQRRRQVRTRDAQRVVVACVDAHVRARRHVAGRARGARRSRGVMRVIRAVVLRRLVALRAHRVAGRAQLERVRIVAIRAGDAVRVHPALRERAPVVDLVAHLPVGEVEAFVEQRAAMRVERRLAVHVVVEMRDARSWQRAQVSSSRDDPRGTLRRALPDAATGVQLTPLRSSSASARPFVASSAFQSPSLRAQVACVEPGPWQASHDTFNADHVVL